MQKFFIPNDNIDKNTAIIKGQDARHIAKVLRMCIKDKILFTNGKGIDFSSTITKLSPKEIALTIDNTYSSEVESPVKITVFQGMLKDKKMDTLIRHLTELGISAWTPFFCERSIPKPDEKRVDSRLKRWEKITIEALKQCNRSIIPEINKPATFTDIIEKTAPFDLKITFWENASLPINKLKLQQKNIETIGILIGPEGGFSKKEVDFAENAGFQVCGLGPRILRAETASLTACSLIQHYFGDI